MTVTKKITTPIALQDTSTALVCSPWFVEGTEYAPATGTFRPLVNGEEAFGTIYDAIQAATASVDIICWGFQPSMMFKRNGSATLSIGDLLVERAKSNVRVRLLIWMDALHASEFSENNMPGNSPITRLKQGIAAIPGTHWFYADSNFINLEYETDDQLSWDREWYRRAFQKIQAESRFTGPKYYPAFSKNLMLATRDFSMTQREEIAYRTELFSVGDKRDATLKDSNKKSLYWEPTHHQKMVLVDYEKPDSAVGFVMGHNMLDQYWDRNEHSYKKATPTTGRSGPHPWQDMSSRVTGPLLEYLNRNFAQAWDDATHEGITQARANFGKQLKPRADLDDTPIMGQIVRTQSQHNSADSAHGGTQDIEKMYLQAVNNATQFIFIQNQYFRWVPLADKLIALANTHATNGRDPERDGYLYLFVLTNSSDAGVGMGTMSTYHMLGALGQQQGMPTIAKEDRDAQLTRQLGELKTDAYDQQDLADYPTTNNAETNAIETATARKAIARDEAQEKILQNQINSKIVVRDIPGLKVHICTLVSPDSPEGTSWEDVYIHAKLMVIDDAFTTLGSANLNLRSMEADSELNILHADHSLSSGLRRRLWDLHTKGMGSSDDPKEAFGQWNRIINLNQEKRAKMTRPVASVVEFLRTSDSRSYND